MRRNPPVLRRYIIMCIKTNARWQLILLVQKEKPTRSSKWRWFYVHSSVQVPGSPLTGLRDFEKCDWNLEVCHRYQICLFSGAGNGASHIQWWAYSKQLDATCQAPGFVWSFKCTSRLLKRVRLGRIEHKIGSNNGIIASSPNCIHSHSSKLPLVSLSVLFATLWTWSPKLLAHLVGLPASATMLFAIGTRPCSPACWCSDPATNESNWPAHVYEYLSAYAACGYTCDNSTDIDTRRQTIYTDFPNPVVRCQLSYPMRIFGKIEVIDSCRVGQIGSLFTRLCLMSDFSDNIR